MRTRNGVGPACDCYAIRIDAPTASAVAFPFDRLREQARLLQLPLKRGVTSMGAA